MNIAYKTKGSLALKPLPDHREPTLRVIEGKQRNDSLAQHLLEQAFAEYAHEPRSKSVAAALGNMAGVSLLHEKRERIFAVIASGIACIALFYFSFFAF